MSEIVSDEERLLFRALLANNFRHEHIDATAALFGDYLERRAALAAVRAVIGEGAG